MTDANNRRSPRALKARFPYMFFGPLAGSYLVYFYRGWMPILTWACEEIDAALGDDKRSFEWEQLKEEAGTGRFSYRLARRRSEGDTGKGVRSVPVGPSNELQPPDAVSSAIASIVARAVAETQVACIVCGAGALPRKYGPLTANLCAAHQPRDENDADWYHAWQAAHLGDDDD